MIYTDVCGDRLSLLGFGTMRLPCVSGPEDKRPEDCIACGQCAKACPQKIDVPKAMRDFGEARKNAPSWADIVAERSAAAKRNKD